MSSLSSTCLGYFMLYRRFILIIGHPSSQLNFDLLHFNQESCLFYVYFPHSLSLCIAPPTASSHFRFQVHLYANILSQLRHIHYTLYTPNLSLSMNVSVAWQGFSRSLYPFYRDRYGDPTTKRSSISGNPLDIG